MARRIVIACDHDRTEPHPLPDAIPVHILGSAGMTFAESDMCEGGRVLDPGSYVLIEKVVINPDVKEWPDKVLLALEGRHWTGIAEVLDALAGGEQP